MYMYVKLKMTNVLIIHVQFSNKYVDVYISNC